MKKLFNFRPILFCALSFIAGILSAFLFCTNCVVLAWVVLIAFCVCIISWLIYAIIKKKGIKSVIIFCIVFVLLSGVGATILSVRYTNFVDANIGRVNVYINGKIKAIEPIENGNYLVLDNVNVSGDTDGKLKFAVAVYVYGEREFRLGDSIGFNGFMSDINLVYEGEFQKYLASDGIRYRVSVNADEIEFLSSKPTMFESVKLFISDTLKSGLGEDEYPVAYALLCGDSEWMDSEIITSYRNAGVAHIFAVSGLHVGFLAFVFNFIFNKIGIKRYWKAGIVTIILLLYSGVCGFTASSLRACIMSATLLFASASGKKYDALSAISFSAIIVLAISPFQLFCAGFQLSYCVCIGIIVLTNPVSKLMTWLPKKLSNSISVALIAQIVGLPIMIAHFGEFSLISILANVILIPVVGVLYVVLFVCMLLAGITTLYYELLFVPGFLIKGINFIITSIDYDKLMIGGIVLGGCSLIFYAILLIMSGLIKIRKTLKIILCVSLSVIFIVSTVIYNINYDNSVRAYVIGTDSFCGTLITAGDEDFLIVNYAEINFNAKRLRRALNKLEIDRLDKLIILRNGNDIRFAEIVDTVLCSVIMDEVVYCDNYDSDEFGMLNQAFYPVNIVNVDNEAKLNFNNVNCSIIAGGFGISVATDKNTVVFASNLKSTLLASESFTGVHANYLVCCDSVLRLNELIKPDKVVTYLDIDTNEDAEKQGNYLINLS